MTTPVQPVPAGYPTVSPSLCVAGAAQAIDFYTTVLGATERMRMGGPGGTVGHAELAIGDSVIMLSDEYPDMDDEYPDMDDEYPDMDVVGPKTVGGTPVTLYAYVEDVDATFDRAVQAGATVLRPVQNHFYGDRSGQFEDPFGHRWSVATHVEDVAPEETARRAAEVMGGG